MHIKKVITDLENHYTITTLIYWVLDLLVEGLVIPIIQDNISLTLTIMLSFDLVLGTLYLAIVIRRCYRINIQPHILILMYFLSSKVFFILSMGLILIRTSKNIQLSQIVLPIYGIIERFMIVMLLVMVGCGYYICVIKFNLGQECYLYRTIGMYCATCGCTRMLVGIINGDLAQGLVYNPIYLMNLCSMLYILWRYLKGRRVPIWVIGFMMVANVIIVVIRNGLGALQPLT